MDRDTSMSVHWVRSDDRLPIGADKYVVMIDCGGGICYATTRSYNPTAIASKGWLNMLHGETVSHWLEGLVTPHEQELVAMRQQAAQSA